MWNLLKIFHKKNDHLAGNRFPLVVVGQIIEIKKHPEADKLTIVKVDIGDKQLDIVCGANNIEVGQFVPVALEGAHLPSGVVISSKEIRGQISKGMLCSAQELGLGEDHDGIMILDKSIVKQPGQSLDSYLNNK